VYCSVLQCIAVCFNVSQFAAMCRSMLQCAALSMYIMRSMKYSYKHVEYQ